MVTTETGTLFLHPDRNLAMELVRATEAAAIRATPFIGHGDKLGADGAAVDALWRSQAHDNNTSAGVNGDGGRNVNSSLQIREWTSCLLGRSLLMGSMAMGTIKVHDLVMNNMRAQFTNRELYDGHRAFVDTLLAHKPFTTTTSKPFDSSSQTSPLNVHDLCRPRF